MISQYIPFHMVKSGWYGGIGHGSSASSAPAAPHLWTPRFRFWDWDNMAHPAVNIWMNGIYTDLYGFLWVNMVFLWIYLDLPYVCINVYIYISYGFMWIYIDYVLLVMDDVLILSNRWNMTFSLMITSMSNCQQVVLGNIHPHNSAKTLKNRTNMSERNMTMFHLHPWASGSTSPRVAPNSSSQLAHLHSMQQEGIMQGGAPGQPSILNIRRLYLHQLTNLQKP